MVRGRRRIRNKAGCSKSCMTACKPCGSTIRGPRQVHRKQQTDQQHLKKRESELFMSDPNQNAAAAPAPKTSNTKRRMLMALIVLVVIIAAVAYGFYYFLIARFHESTDDAYVNGNVVQITPQVVGTVISVNADDTQTVHVGEPLVVLDPADSKVALDQAEANLAQTVRQVRTLFVNNDQFQAQGAIGP